MATKLIKTVVLVEDIEKSMNMLRKQFGQPMEIVYEETSGYYSAQHNGFQFLQPKQPPETAPESQLLAMCLGVEDAKAIADKMEADGFVKKGEKIVDGWFIKEFFPDFHGIPLILTSVIGPAPVKDADRLAQDSETWIFDL